MSEENPGKDLIGNLGVIGLRFILLLPIILPILWWFGFFEEPGEEGEGGSSSDADSQPSTNPIL